MMGMLLFVGSSITDEMVDDRVLLHIHVEKPIHPELKELPQNTDRHRKTERGQRPYTGESVNLIFASRFRMSISEKPTAAVSRSSCGASCPQ